MQSSINSDLQNPPHAKARRSYQKYSSYFNLTFLWDIIGEIRVVMVIQLTHVLLACALLSVQSMEFAIYNNSLYVNLRDMWGHESHDRGHATLYGLMHLIQHYKDSQLMAPNAAAVIYNIEGDHFAV
jgi:hypothetical protein